MLTKVNFEFFCAAFWRNKGGGGVLCEWVNSNLMDVQFPRSCLFLNTTENIEYIIIINKKLDLVLCSACVLHFITIYPFTAKISDHI